jgi:hypothetical protein
MTDVLTDAGRKCIGNLVESIRHRARMLERGPGSVSREERARYALEVYQFAGEIQGILDGADPAELDWPHATRITCRYCPCEATRLHFCNDCYRASMGEFVCPDKVMQKLLCASCYLEWQAEGFTPSLSTCERCYYTFERACVKGRIKKAEPEATAAVS